MPENPQPITDPLKNTYVQVALPVPLRKNFDYLPPLVAAALQPGLRVRVPFGKQMLIGIIVAITTETCVPQTQLKPILAVIDTSPLFPTTIYELLCWTSAYYQYPLGLVFETALPIPLRNGKTLADYQQNNWQLTSLATTDSPTQLKAKKQQQLLDLLATHPAGIAEQTLNQQGFSKAIRDKLVAKNLIVLAQAMPSLTAPTQQPADYLAVARQLALPLNSEQQTALAAVVKSFNKFQTFLLDGVTGSGKTEVYLQAIAAALQQGKQVLVLIPEISLTPQTVAQFQHRFATNIVIFHSQISDKERTIAWLQAKLGNANIIIGTRSAAFMPLQNPGLFIIDEEHDQSFKQQDGLRYSARDLLIKRAQLENCPIILGSATPALETLWNAQQARYVHLRLSARAGKALPPSLEVLDIRHKKLNQGLSLQLLAQIAEHLKNQGQVLLFLNRRGYAPVLMCSNCNWIQNCNRCDSRMILHFQPKPCVICHQCQTQRKLPTHCPNCSNPALAPIGFGTEKLEQILASNFPAAKIVRVDSDTTSRKNAMQNIVSQVISGQANILIGTQMLAKGHHFPKLSLVAIIDIDSSLFSADFRTIERLGQLITQVAGRAGRAELPGKVILQTSHPDHPLLQELLTAGYHALCRSLLVERKNCKLPPFSHQILFRAASLHTALALDFLFWLKNNTNNSDQLLEILGPIPAPIEKKASYFRAQLLIQSNKRALLHAVCKNLIAKIEIYPKVKQVLWSVDVDPLDFY